MLIDWFTVGAQVLNFLILVWLLKRFLYKPILQAIDAREKHIVDELADADAKKSAAEKERDDFHQKNKTFDEQRSTLLAKATYDARTEHDRLFEEARKTSDVLRAKQADALQNDQVRLGNEITRLTSAEVFAIARKTLADLATVSLEERISEVFMRRLGEMDAKAKSVLAEALRTSSEPAVVRSTFEVSSEQRVAIQKALNETFSTEIRVAFETAPDGVCGIELTVNGQKLAWSIADYLVSLKRKLNALLEMQAKPAVAATTKADTGIESSPAVPHVEAA